MKGRPGNPIQYWVVFNDVVYGQAKSFLKHDLSYGRIGEALVFNSWNEAVEYCVLDTEEPMLVINGKPQKGTK